MSELGSTRLLSSKDVRARTSLSRATIWRKIGAGEFPRPVRLGPNRVAWVEAQVDAWIERKVAGGRPQ